MVERVCPRTSFIGKRAYLFTFTDLGVNERAHGGGGGGCGCCSSSGSSSSSSSSSSSRGGGSSSVVTGFERPIVCTESSLDKFVRGHGSWTIGHDGATCPRTLFMGERVIRKLVGTSSPVKHEELYKGWGRLS